jgi:tRNA-modifying protein YgfZ
MTRALLTVTGTDATHFLQGLITNDITQVSEHQAIFAAMLSPQGKWQHDFFIARYRGGYALDHDAAHSDMLQKRLKLYKLRAQVNLALLPEFSLHYMAPAPRSTLVHASETMLHFGDVRHADMPSRYWSQTVPEGTRSNMDYLRIRLALGIPEGRTDITENDTAMDAGFDMLHAISFTKGCYVGQEITARMHYKDIARKGFFTVCGTAPLTPCPITNGAGKEVARMHSAHEMVGLAYGKFDDLPLGETYHAGNVPITLQVPTWMTEKYTKFIPS